MPQIHLLLKAASEVMLLLMFVCIVGVFVCVCVEYNWEAEYILYGYTFIVLQKKYI